MGGGPAGYEAALVAAQHGSDVTVVERDGMGGACVLDDCVPSKTFISSAGVRVDMHRAPDLGVITDPQAIGVDLPTVHARVKGLALAQSADVRARVEREGVRIIRGTAAFTDESSAHAPHLVEARTPDGGREELLADVVLIATGATPRVLPDAVPDGERILTWRQLYDLQELPEHLIVIGSGVTGAEFVSAYVELGARVTLVSSRDRVLPGEDADAAAVLQDVFTERGVRILSQARADSVKRDGDGVVVTLPVARSPVRTP
jgi:dihydrolipoamide dehydrogenase